MIQISTQQDKPTRLSITSPERKWYQVDRDLINAAKNKYNCDFFFTVSGLMTDEPDATGIIEVVDTYFLKLCIDGDPVRKVWVAKSAIVAVTIQDGRS